MSSRSTPDLDSWDVLSDSDVQWVDVSPPSTPSTPIATPHTQISKSTTSHSENISADKADKEPVEEITTNLNADAGTLNFKAISGVYTAPHLRGKTDPNPPKTKQKEKKKKYASSDSPQANRPEPLKVKPADTLDHWRSTNPADASLSWRSSDSDPQSQRVPKTIVEGMAKKY
ncbi:hypothetical protein M422DRAFT_776459 [Sphaerobolus stellatus SS14]|nr:hypothetical protein M422DRAFT_776459 [Sphaerobolus stellatus SS14]